MDHRIRIKESEKIEKFLHIASELTKLWNMRVARIPIVVGAFGTVSKGLEKGVNLFVCFFANPILLEEQ